MGGKEARTGLGQGTGEEESELEEGGRRREDIMVFLIKEMEVPWQMGLSPQTQAVWRLSSNT